MCEWKPDFERLDARVDAIESRLSSVESATRDGLAAVNANIETLSQQLNNMDARIVEEKVKWGGTFRNLVTWTVKALLVTALTAAGVNLTINVIKAVVGR